MAPAAAALVGFVLAGGRSSRMGRDKATLSWHDGDLLDHAIARLADVTSDVRILCGPEARHQGRGRPVVTDAVPGAGAIAGLLAALRALPPDGRALLLAVDLPLVTPGVLRALAAASAGVDAAVPVTAAGPEPLCAVYGAGCREAIERAVAAGRFKMTAFWPAIRVREVREDELRAFGDPALLFCNVNTPEDLERARALARR